MVNVFGFLLLLLFGFYFFKDESSSGGLEWRKIPADDFNPLWLRHEVKKFQTQGWNGQEKNYTRPTGKSLRLRMRMIEEKSIRVLQCA